MKYIIKEGNGIYKEKNSKFISICFSISNIIEFNEKLSKIKEIHKNATHFTFALRILDKNGNLYEKFSDNNEPYGTAGIPMLNLLKTNLIVNSAIITVRYFGGIKLGKSNLLKAYLNSSNLALNDATIEELIEKEEYNIEFPYNCYETLNHIFEENQIEINQKRFGEVIEIDFKVPKNSEESLISKIKNIKSKIKINKF